MTVKGSEGVEVIWRKLADFSKILEVVGVGGRQMDSELLPEMLFANREGYHDLCQFTILQFRNSDFNK